MKFIERSPTGRADRSPRPAEDRQLTDDALEIVSGGGDGDPDSYDYAWSDGRRGQWQLTAARSSASHERPA